MNELISIFKERQSEMDAWFEHLHRNPELGFQEEETARFIAERLKSWGYDVVEQVGKTGLVATMNCGDSGKAIGLRADMDALPVEEDASHALRSEVPGVSHMCGHDSHCTMLLAAARYLAETKNFNGTVRLVFQPSEENMAGAQAMLDDGLLKRFPVDAMFGLHALAGIDLGTICFRPGAMFAAVDNWEIELEGKGSHGSMPEKGIDPIVAGSSLVMALQTIVSRNVAPTDPAVVTVGAFQAGEAGNVIPQKAVLRLSIRSSTENTRALVLKKVRSITKAQAEAFNVTYAIREGQPGAVLVNDAELAKECTAVAESLLGAARVNDEGPFFMGSEDFAFYAQSVPSLYAILGNGDSMNNHHPDFVVDQSILPIGAAYWVAVVEHFLR